MDKDGFWGCKFMRAGFIIAYFKADYFIVNLHTYVCGYNNSISG